MKKDDNLRREHEAIRNGVGFYNFTHDLLEVRGKEAGACLDRIFVNNIGGTRVGDAIYTTMLDEEGHIIDDVIIFRLEDERFWVSTLDVNFMIEWFDKNLESGDFTYEDITSKVSMYAIQGPDSERVLNSLLKDSIEDLGYLKIMDNELQDMSVKVARSGFTGELGYELYTVPECNSIIEDILEHQGDPLGITQITTNVIIGSIPTEKGYVLMSDLKGLNPIEAGFGWSIDWSSDFIGKDAIMTDGEDGPKRSLLGFELEDVEEATIEAGTKVMKDGREVGSVTKFEYGYSVEKFIGFAVIDNDLAKISDDVEIGGYKATLTPRAFYDIKNKRVREKAK